MTKTRLLNILSLIFNVAIVVLTIIAFLLFFIQGGTGNMEVMGLTSLRYFTVLSNILCAITASLIIPFNIQAIVVNKNQIPFWALLAKFIGTIAVSVTFFTVLLFLGPLSGGYKSLFSGPGFYMHLVTPLIAVASIVVFENKEDYDWEYNLFALIPTIVYSLLYLVQVAFTKNWEDFYGFTFGGHYWLAPFSMIVMYGLTFGISMGLWGLRKLCTRAFYKPARKRRD